MNEQTQNLIEAFLFWKNEPISIKKISDALKIEVSEVKTALESLKNKLQGGIVLLEKGEEVVLGVAPVASDLIKKMTEDELSRELSKAALETLSIVLYKNPVKRSEIDYIRGVNSQFILRHLEMRGLVEKTEAPDDGRSYVYKPSFDLLGHLGISEIKELPEYDVLRQAVENFEKANQTNEEAGNLNNTEENVSENLA